MKVFLIVRPRISLPSELKIIKKNFSRWVTILWNRFWSVDFPAVQQKYSNQGIIHSRQCMLVWLLHASGGIIKLKVSELEPPKKKKNYSISIAWEVSMLLWRNESRPVCALSSRQLRKHYFFFLFGVFLVKESHKTHICIKQDVGETQWFQIIYLKKERMKEWGRHWMSRMEFLMWEIHSNVLQLWANHSLQLNKSDSDSVQKRGLGEHSQQCIWNPA